MNSTTIEERKAKLQSEILFAEANLIHNIANLNASDYLFPRGLQLPDILSSLANNSGTAIEAMDSVSRTVLPSSNIFYKIFKYLSIGMRAYNTIFKPKKS